MHFVSGVKGTKPIYLVHYSPELLPNSHKTVCHVEYHGRAIIADAVTHVKYEHDVEYNKLVFNIRIVHDKK